MTGGLKDLRMMVSTASDVNAPLEVGKIIERKLAAGVDSGMGETDWSAIYAQTLQVAADELSDLFVALHNVR
jgi:3-hydroxyisobutyrate dehydrogenase-like beta-hydroxyacid dehydrogenase